MPSKNTDEGAESENPRSWMKDLGFAGLTMIVHLLVALVVLAYTGGVVPRFSKYYDDWGTQLSDAVVSTILLSRVVVTYWYLFVFAVAWNGGVIAMALRFLPKNLCWAQICWLIAWPLTAIVLLVLNVLLLSWYTF